MRALLLIVLAAGAAVGVFYVWRTITLGGVERSTSPATTSLLPRLDETVPPGSFSRSIRAFTEFLRNPPRFNPATE